MKPISLALVSLASLSMFFSSIGFARILTPNERRAVLNQLSSTCGDTWCEGDHQIEFQSVQCDQRGFCHIRLELVEHGSKAVSFVTTKGMRGAFIADTIQARCTIGAIRSISDLITESGLNERFYNGMTDCIGEIQSRARTQ